MTDGSRDSTNATAVPPRPSVRAASMRSLPVIATVPAPAQPPSPPARSTRSLLLGVGIGLAAWWPVYRSLQPLADWLTYGVLGLGRSTRLAESVAFFLYDTPKVLLLL